MLSKPIVTAFVAVPLVLAASYSSRSLSRCCHCVDPSKLAVDQDYEDCCFDEPASDAPDRLTVQSSDPAKQLVFKVESLRCPAVKGIGCGHLLRPLLLSLDKVEGVQSSSVNYTGTMIRVAVVETEAKAKVDEAVRKALAKNKPSAVAGDAFKTALEKEQWREAWRVGELSAIEFRAITMYRVDTFVKAEKLNKEAAGKLAKWANELWDGLEQKGKKNKGGLKPQEWLERLQETAPEFLSRSKELLNEEQVERLTETLKSQCRGDDRPEAPPPPTVKKKSEA